MPPDNEESSKMNAEDGSPHEESGDSSSPNDKTSTPGMSSSSDSSDRNGAVSNAFGQEIPGSSSGTSEQGKRQKTGQSSAFPGIAASPPKFVSLEEIMSTASGMKNMALAHEIAVDDNFKLKKVEPPENSIQKQVKETMHKLFWEILERELNETPPNYTQALVLLRDVKEGLFSLLLPQHTKLKSEITEVLDEALIKQQAENGVLDFQHYAQYVISVMAKLCAPIRDEKIRHLTQTKDVVPMFKGILETLDLMKLDMANFTIDLFRPGIIAKSVEYEKQKFAEFLKIQSDGLKYTRKWLLRHFEKQSGRLSNVTPEDPMAVRNVTVRVLGDAYMELLEWDPSETYPETVMMDEARFADLGVKSWRLAVTGAILLATVSAVPPLQSVQTFKEQLKEHLHVLLEETDSDKDLEKVLPNIADQVLKDINDAFETHGFRKLEETTIKTIRGQILDIGKPEQKIRHLVRVRVLEFLQQCIMSATAAPLQVPPGLSSLKNELTVITGPFLRLVSHNRAVYGEYYTDIITSALSSLANNAIE